MAKIIRPDQPPIGCAPGTLRIALRRYDAALARRVPPTLQGAQP
jgi:hypothetical protein